MHLSRGSVEVSYEISYFFRFFFNTFFLYGFVGFYNFFGPMVSRCNNYAKAVQTTVIARIKQCNTIIGVIGMLLPE